MKTDPRIRLPGTELLEQIGRGLKRVKSADEKPDARGFRTIWHHGPMKTDLFSFVGPDRSLSRQELVFLGNAVSWDTREGVQTGAVDTVDSPSAPAAQQVDYADGGRLDVRALLQASGLLRSVEAADYYTQHLRKAVNERLKSLGAPATDIAELDPELQAELQRLFDVSQEVATLPRSAPVEDAPRSRTALYLAVGLAVGAGLVAVATLLLR